MAAIHSFLLALLYADRLTFHHLDRIFSLYMNVLSYILESIEQHKSAFPKSAIKGEKREKKPILFPWEAVTDTCLAAHTWLSVSG